MPHDPTELLRATTAIVVAAFAANRIGEGTSVSIAQIYSALANTADGIATDAPEADTEFTPAVSIRKSLASKDHIISMIDGKPYKTLRRHLAGHGLTPAEYRARYGLKADYPIVSENYSEARRAMAKRIGLGRKPGTKVAK